MRWRGSTEMPYTENTLAISRVMVLRAASTPGTAATLENENKIIKNALTVSVQNSTNVVALNAIQIDIGIEVPCTAKVDTLRAQVDLCSPPSVGMVRPCRGYSTYAFVVQLLVLFDKASLNAVHMPHDRGSCLALDQANHQ